MLFVHSVTILVKFPVWSNPRAKKNPTQTIPTTTIKKQKAKTQTKQKATGGLEKVEQGIETYQG